MSVLGFKPAFTHRSVRQKNKGGTIDHRRARRRPIFRALGLCFLSFVFCAIAVAQNDLPAKPLTLISAGDAARRVPDVFELPLKWSDRATGLLSVVVRNDLDKPVVVLGTQATGGIFVSDYPTAIGAKKEDTISFVYNAADDSDEGVETIRVLTDRGILETTVKMAREEVVSLDTRQVSWVVGDKPEAKTVTIKVPSGKITPYRTTTFGGSKSVLQKVNDTTWTVSITPATTSRAWQFPVMVVFDQPLPGRATVIVASVKSAQ